MGPSLSVDFCLLFAVAIDDAAVTYQSRGYRSALADKENSRVHTRAYQMFSA
jgi:hypothetical protein